MAIVPADVWAIASLPAAEAGLYVQALASVPKLPAVQADVFAAAAPLPAVAWIDRPAPVQLVPGSLMLLAGDVRITWPPGGGGLVTLWGVSVVHANPPDLLVGWCALDSPMRLESGAQVWVATLSLLLGRVTE